MGLFFPSRKERQICKCDHCDYILSPCDTDRPFCPKCGGRQSLEKRLAVLDFYPHGGVTTLVKAKCPKCGCEDAFAYDCEYFYDVNCTECGYEISSSTEGKINLESSAPTYIPEKPKIECPYCHSTNTKKISTASKAGSVALFGIFAAGKVSKQWHCNNCKSDF